MTDRRCKACDAPIPADAHWRREFCDDKCKYRAYGPKQNAERKQRRAGIGRAIRGELTCPVCEQTVPRKRIHQIYCSSKCGAKARHDGRHRTTLDRRPQADPLDNPVTRWACARWAL